MSEDLSAPTGPGDLLGRERLRSALAAAGIGTWHLDLRRNVATCDDGLNRILGTNHGDAEIPLATYLAFIHPDDRARVRATFEHAAPSPLDFSHEFRIVRGDGHTRWLRDRGRIITDGHGSAVAATGAAMDVTEQRRRQEHDRLLARTTHALASSADCDGTLASLAEEVVAGSVLACTIVLRTADRARTIAAGPPAFAPSEAQIAEAMRAAAPVTDGTHLLLPLRAGGRALGVLALAARDPLDAVDEAFAGELAMRVALGVERARLLGDLERANRAKDEFLATLSNELRSPLNAVLGWLRMLRRGTVPPDRTAHVLEAIERHATAQMLLVEDLLDLSAMTAGGLRLNVTTVDLRDLIGGAVEAVRPAADAKGLHVNLSIDATDAIAGDPARLRQVLWNLLANAVKFTPAGGVIEVAVVEGPSDTTITVRDSGAGIPATVLPHLFEPFPQDGPARTAGGLCLGLALVRRIVEAHGGTVAASSDGPGLGASFAVRLPTGRSQHAGAAAGSPTLRGRRVLAVDDDESSQELVATMLLLYGVSVRTAGGAEQAMQILAGWRPDVLLTDIAMPGEDGYGLMRRVRALPPPLGGIPAVALTGYTDPHSVQQAFAAGFDAHLGKPLEPHVLADALSKVLRIRR